MKKCYATIYVWLHDMDHNIDLNYRRKIRPVIGHWSSSLVQYAGWPIKISSGTAHPGDETKRSYSKSKKNSELFGFGNFHSFNKS